MTCDLVISDHVFEQMLAQKKTHFFLCCCFCFFFYLFLQLFHKADGIGQRPPLVTRQRLQVQDGLRALGFENPDGLQQPLVTDVKQ